MVRTQIEIEEEQIEWLRSEARKRGISVSQLIREGIAFFRAREQRFPEEKKQRALAAIGKCGDGGEKCWDRGFVIPDSGFRFPALDSGFRLPAFDSGFRFRLSLLALGSGTGYVLAE